MDTMGKWNAQYVNLYEYWLYRPDSPEHCDLHTVDLSTSELTVELSSLSKVKKVYCLKREGSMSRKSSYPTQGLAQCLLNEVFWKLLFFLFI